MEQRATLLDAKSQYWSRIVCLGWDHSSRTLVLDFPHTYHQFLNLSSDSTQRYCEFTAADHHGQNHLRRWRRWHDFYGCYHYNRRVESLVTPVFSVILIIFCTDMAPLSQVAVLRSYVNIAAVIGRSVGGPIGGVLFDRIGWRWYVSSLIEAPILPGH